MSEMPAVLGGGTVAIVPARGGSKGLPRKAELPVGGVPLLGRTILAARGATAVGRIVVSTDDPHYADLARHYGAEIPFLRPACLATDTASVRDVVVHLLARLDPQPAAIVLLQPTSPFTTAADIDGAARLLDATADAVVSVCPSEVQPDWLRRPDEEGWLRPVCRLDVPPHTARQAMPPVYRLNGAIYWVRTAAFAREQSFLPPRTRPFVMDARRSIDIDTPWELSLAEWLAPRFDAVPGRNREGIAHVAG